jgi:toxin ParE1/3/4
MRSFKFKIQPRVYDEIQNGITYYNKKQKGLGRKFHKAVKSSFQTIRESPFYQVRYERVRCLPVTKFPFMVHYIVDKSTNTIIVYALINTHIDPEISYVNK